jgi:hypothetical protein
MRTLVMAFVLVLFPLWGCATGSSSSQRGPGSSRNTITREQLAEMPSMTAHDAIRRLHRDWLMGKATTMQSVTGRTYAQVFLDGRPYGSLEVLTQFGTQELDEIRFISSSDATTRYGTGYPAGIIELLSRRVPNS